MCTESPQYAVVLEDNIDKRESRTCQLPIAYPSPSLSQKQAHQPSFLGSACHANLNLNLNNQTHRIPAFPSRPFVSDSPAWASSATRTAFLGRWRRRCFGSRVNDHTTTTEVRGSSLVATRRRYQQRLVVVGGCSWYSPCLYTP